MSEVVVEIHVPLIPEAGLSEDEYQYPWILRIDEFLLELDGDGGVMFDDGEELGDEYLFFVTSAPEETLIDLARTVANLPGVPDGVYVTVTTSDSEDDMGTGRRVDLER